MKNKTKAIWLVMISFFVIVVGYMYYYPITAVSIKVQHIVKDKFGVDSERISGIELNSKDCYFFTTAADNLVVMKMERGMFDRYRYKGMSYTDANFVNGVVNSGGNKYLLVGGRNPNHEIEKIAFTLDNIQYDITLVNPGNTFFEYVQIDSETVDDHIFLDNTTLYNIDGEDITIAFNTSSGGL